MNHAKTLMRGMLALAVLLVGPVLAQHEHAGKSRPPPLAIGAAFSPSGELRIAGLDAKLGLSGQTNADECRPRSAPRALHTAGHKHGAESEKRAQLPFRP